MSAMVVSMTSKALDEAKVFAPVTDRQLCRGGQFTSKLKAIRTCYTEEAIDVRAVNEKFSFMSCVDGSAKEANRSIPFGKRQFLAELNDFIAERLGEPGAIAVPVQRLSNDDITNERHRPNGSFGLHLTQTM